MNIVILGAACAVLMTSLAGNALGAPAIEALGRDFTFPNQIDGVPGKLSDFKGLHINSFKTNDGVKLSGDQFPALKNPVKFTDELSSFLER
jgi:hypothetical protein